MLLHVGDVAGYLLTLQEAHSGRIAASAQSVTCFDAMLGQLGLQAPFRLGGRAAVPRYQPASNSPANIARICAIVSPCSGCSTRRHSQAKPTGLVPGAVTRPPSANTFASR